MKSAMPKMVLIGSLFLVSVSFAAQAKTQIEHTGMKYSSLSAGIGSGDINCDQNASDVCIANNSNQTVYFNVPAFNQAGSLNPPYWVDVWENPYAVPYIQVMINNSYNQPIFDQAVPNHSIINITNNSVAGGKNQLNVTVVHG